MLTGNMSVDYLDEVTLALKVKLVDSVVQSDERSCPPDASAAVHHLGLESEYV